jgi:GNAT superfamily N-acetyltransferase
MDSEQSDVERALEAVEVPAGVTIRAWEEQDFPAIQALSQVEGWPTPMERLDEALLGWHNSWPTLVALADGSVIGFVRAITDGVITTYVAELLVSVEWRGRGIASVLLNVTQLLGPGTRLDLLATEQSRSFYERAGFHPFAGYRRRWVDVESVMASFPLI